MKHVKLNSFISGTGIYLISNIINSIIPFLLLPVLTRFLDPAQYGKVAMFQTLLGVLSAFVGTVFVGAAARKYYDSNLSPSDLSKYIGSCIQLAVFSSTVTLIFFIIFRYQLSNWFSLDLNFIFIAVFVAFCSVIINIRLTQWQVRKQALKYGILQISISLTNAIISILLVVMLLQGASGRINAQFITSFLFLIITIILLKKDKLSNILMIRKDLLKDILRFGLPLIPHISGTFLLLSIDRFLLNKELGLKEVGIYMVALQLVNAMSIIFDAVNKAYTPYLYETLKNNNFNEKLKIVKGIYIWFILILVGVGIVFKFGPWFIVFFAGKEYEAAGKVIGLLALAQGFRGMYLMVTNFIFYTKKTEITAYITFITGSINVVLLIFLIKQYGLIGAASANAISMGLFFVTTWFFASRLVDMPWRLK